MNKKKAITILAIIALLSITVTSLSYSFFVVREVKVLPYDFTIKDYIGFNVDKDALHFGTILKNGQSSRNLIITNNYQTRILVYFNIEGRGSEFFIVEENGFILMPSEEKKLSLTVKIPENAVFDTYTGKVFIIFKRI